MKDDLRETKEQEDNAAEFRKGAKNQKDYPTMATHLNEQATLADDRAKRFNDDAAKDRQKADSLMAEARASWRKLQEFEKTPCPNNMPSCAPAPTHKMEKEHKPCAWDMKKGFETSAGTVRTRFDVIDK